MVNPPISPMETTKEPPPSVQPNAHPYAVKTTSSALLSRSNSSPHSPHHTRHHYVPSSLSQIPTGTRARHRHSSSLSAVEAELSVRAILQVPPSIDSVLLDHPMVSMRRADEPKLAPRARRAETISLSHSPMTNHSYDQKHEHHLKREFRPELYDTLPPNPKQWNTDELTTYLERSLKPDNNTNSDKADSSLLGILECVRARGLTGRELLRLTDTDLTDTPLSDMQRTQLLEHSRNLRANVLRGRFYVDSYHSHEVSDNLNDVYSRSAHSSTPFHNIHSASVSVDDLRVLLDNAGEGTSPTKSLYRSNSAFDASAQRYRDLARMRMRRRGKVKGLVKTWERARTSGSECSTSGEESGSVAGSESETDPELESPTDSRHSSESQTNLMSPSHHEQSRDIHPTMMDSAVVLQEPFLSTPPPPYTHTRTVLEAVRDEEEPSIEELLASSSSTPLRGARAWEADFCLGETVKRIPVSLNADEGHPCHPVVEANTSHLKCDSGQPREASIPSKGSVTRASTGSKGKSPKTQKRVVSAIFMGPPSVNVSKSVGSEINSVDHASGISSVVHGEAPARSDLQDNSDDALQALEESVAATRAQVEAFKLRLEKVEADTARREAELEQAEYSDSCHFSEFELRQRRPAATEHATPGRAGISRDKTLVETFSIINALQSWRTMSTGDIARTIVARAMGWVFPYGHMGPSVHEDRGQSQACTCSRPRPGVNSRHPSPARRIPSPLTFMACSIMLVSFAVCTAVLRRLGLGRWVRRP